MFAPRFITSVEIEKISKFYDDKEKAGLAEAIKLGMQAMISPPDGINRVFSIPKDGNVDSWATGNGYLQIGKESFALDTPVQSSSARSSVREQYKLWRGWRQPVIDKMGWQAWQLPKYFGWQPRSEDEGYEYTRS